MTRKAISESVERSILTKSRRRCCLCFWLDGADEVKRGQLAHLDRNHENSVEDNLAFLCLEHHDQYDGKSSVSKSLKVEEVRHWRDELYREMEYRFRTIKKHGFELRFVGVVVRNTKPQFGVRFRVKNTGDNSVKRPIVSIRLPENVQAKLPKRMPREVDTGTFGMRLVTPELPEMWAMVEAKEDFFEEGGRVGSIQVVGGMAPVLMRGHSEEFDGLCIQIEDVPPERELELEYRVDAEDVPPVYGKVIVKLPSDEKEILFDFD